MTRTGVFTVITVPALISTGKSSPCRKGRPSKKEEHSRRLKKIRVLFVLRY
jgi:hypothetical protein